MISLAATLIVSVLIVFTMTENNGIICHINGFRGEIYAFILPLMLLTIFRNRVKNNIKNEVNHTTDIKVNDEETSEKKV